MFYLYSIPGEIFSFCFLHTVTFLHVLQLDVIKRQIEIETESENGNLLCMAIMLDYTHGNPHIHTTTILCDDRHTQSLIILLRPHHTHIATSNVQNQSELLFNHSTFFALLLKPESYTLSLRKESMHRFIKHSPCIFHALNQKPCQDIFFPSSSLCACLVCENQHTF